MSTILKRLLKNGTAMNFIKKMIALGILSLGFLGGTAIHADNSITTNQNELKALIQTIIQTNEQLQQFDEKIHKIDGEIHAVETRSEESWLSRRRIVKLTETKVGLNSQRLEKYEMLLEHQLRAQQTSTILLKAIMAEIDTLFTMINSSTSVEERKSGLEQLLKIIALRNWIIDTKPLYTQVEENIIPAKMNIQDYLDKRSGNAQIRRDLITLIDEKIEQISLMIETVREEEQLRSRLEQFSLEMSSLGGEFARTNHPIQPQLKDENNTVISGWDSEGQFGEDNRDYSNWVNNTTQSQLFSPISGYDYLPIIKNLESAELPDYIFTLDSIRTYYLDQRQKLLNR
jgi:hypothetical protein